MTHGAQSATAQGKRSGVPNSRVDDARTAGAGGGGGDGRRRIGMVISRGLALPRLMACEKSDVHSNERK